MQALNSFFNGIGYLFKLFGIAVLLFVLANAWHEAHGPWQSPLKAAQQQQGQN